VEFPSKFLWITALNPCPCGNYKHPFRECVCKPSQIKRYLKKISSPLWDRIDLTVWVNPVEEKTLLEKTREETSEEIRKRVLRAVEIQKRRNPESKFNGELTNGEIEEIVKMEPAAKSLVVKAMEKLHLSVRSYYKLLKVCRTIADLEGSEGVKTSHVSEALVFVREPLEV
jgi:magnesium chelatase family protein